MDHLDEFSLLRLVDGESAEARRAASERHLSGCLSCLRRFEALQAESVLLGSALWETDTPIPQPFRPRRELPWVVAGFMAAAAVGFATLWTRVVQPALTGLETVGVDGGSFASDLVTREVVGDDYLSTGQILTELALLGVIVLAVLGLARGGFGSRRGGTGLSLLVFAGVPLWLALAGGLSPSVAEAAVIERNEERFVLAENEVIDNDLIVLSEAIRIEGTVRGDVVVFGRFVSIDGLVEGDLIGLAQIIEIRGEVRGNLRTGSQSLDVRGAVGRNITSVAERLFFDREARLGGSLTAAGRDIGLLAPIERDVTLAGPTLEINGRVGGSILAAAERLDIGPESRIGGSITFYGEEAPVVDENAELASQPVFEPVQGAQASSTLDRMLSFALSWMAALAFGATLLWLAPAGFRRAIDRLDRAGVDLAIGLGLIIGIPVVAIVLGLSLVGLPLALSALGVYAFALYSSQLFVGSWLGEHLLGRAASYSQALGRLGIGLALVGAAKALPVMGGLVTLVVILWGMGAMARSLWKASPQLGSPVAGP